MGVNPMSMYGYSMPMMNFGASGDFYTDMLQQQLMSKYKDKYGDQAQDSSQTKDSTQGADGVGFNGNPQQQAAKNSSIFGKPLVLGAGGAGLGYVGMTAFNHRFNSPIVTENGVTKFSEGFISKYANQHAAALNETSYNNLYKKYSVKGVAAVPVTPTTAAVKAIPEFNMTAENFPTIKEELGRMVNGEITASELSDETKKFIEAQYKSNKKGFRQIHSELLAEEQRFAINNNMNIQREIKEGYADFVKELEKCKSLTLEEKVAYLKENPKFANLDAKEIEKLYAKKPNAADIDGIIAKLTDKTHVQNRTNALTASISKSEQSINRYASKFNTKKVFNWFNSGTKSFNATGKKTLTALESSLKSFRNAKGGRAALIVGAAGLIIGLFSKK